MRLVNTKIVLKNPRKAELRPVEVEVLVETGSLYLGISEDVLIQLELEKVDKKAVRLADGSKKVIPYVRPIEIRFKNRVGFAGALVMGDQVLLGAIPLEDMDLVVAPGRRADTRMR